MNWEQGSQYHIHAPGWTICRINQGAQRIYELWNTATHECAASAKAGDDVEAAKAVKHLKSLAEAA